MISKTKTHKVNPNASALENYDDLKAHIRKLTARMDWLLDEVDNADGKLAGGHHWGHVGDLVNIARKLEEIDGLMVEKVNNASARARV